MRLTSLDWLIVIAALSVAFIPALLLARRAGSNTTEFFTSGRAAPWWLIAVSMVATTFSTDTPNLVTNLVREKGVSYNWVWWSFLLTGMAWTGVWGGQLVQAWSTFPAAKWDDVPKSDRTHASLNPTGQHEVPWALEQTALPASGSDAGLPGVPAGSAVDLSSVAALATQLGFNGQFHIQVPRGEDGVFTVSADSMSGDLTDPTADRTVHIDRYTGKVLAEAAFKDYSGVAKAMAIGTALHQGDMGWWNAVLNVLLCAAIAFLCVSGVVMWWKRRPKGSGCLVAPGMPQDITRWKTGALVMLGVALAFPLAGATLVGLMLLDALLISRWPALRRVLS